MWKNCLFLGSWFQVRKHDLDIHRADLGKAKKKIVWVDCKVLNVEKDFFLADGFGCLALKPRNSHQKVVSCPPKQEIKLCPNRNSSSVL